ncbi:ketosteroid isomerase-like protein [Mycolicibacterium iranicum]|uniref:Ketosteroid isomerase-like protein n=1 Tax=Mycolicibacterium iranicum TaxID=912594 RepID=A0A839Q2K4_MYCIR|nr:nuclear transport factor 2 family protein [Mycolicibacterium iranicum]MBB2989154.1 ketosteroid isomerase-like protein [Mycolicibacterium iranicum]
MSHPPASHRPASHHPGASRPTTAASRPTTDEARRLHTNAVVDRGLELLLAHDMTAFALLWAPDGTMEFPFAAAGQPARLDGQAAVVDYLAGYTAMLDVRGIASQTRHQTADPSTVVVEFEVEGVAVATQKPYRLGYIAVISVGDDGIVTYRDYWSPQAAAEVLGQPA